jgi:hypothetical protein
MVHNGRSHGPGRLLRVPDELDPPPISATPGVAGMGHPGLCAIKRSQRADGPGSGIPLGRHVGLHGPLHKTARTGFSGASVAPEFVETQRLCFRHTQGAIISPHTRSLHCCSRSNTSTRAPCSAIACARVVPPSPPPIVIISMVIISYVSPALSLSSLLIATPLTNTRVILPERRAAIAVG